MLPEEKAKELLDSYSKEVALEIANKEMFKAGGLVKLWWSGVVEDIKNPPLKEPLR